MHVNRKPCNSFFIVNMSSGMDCGHVRPMTTWSFHNMETILQLNRLALDRVKSIGGSQAGKGKGR